MILGFKTQINGKPTFFKEKILAHLNLTQSANSNAGQGSCFTLKNILSG